MIIPLEKLMVYNENKYYFTKAAMRAVDKAGNIKPYTEQDLNWKVVSNVLKLLVEGEIKMHIPPQTDDNQ